MTYRSFWTEKEEAENITVHRFDDATACRIVVPTQGSLVFQAARSRTHASFVVNRRLTTRMTMSHFAFASVGSGFGRIPRMKTCVLFLCSVASLFICYICSSNDQDGYTASEDDEDGSRNDS